MKEAEQGQERGESQGQRRGKLPPSRSGPPSPAQFHHFATPSSLSLSIFFDFYDHPRLAKSTRLQHCGVWNAVLFKLGSLFVFQTWTVTLYSVVPFAF